MRPHPLAHLIPSSNEFVLRSLRSRPIALTNALESIYENETFSGCFLEDSGGWQERIARYDADEFLSETEGPKLFSEVCDSLQAGDEDDCHVYSRDVYDMWARDGKGSEKPFSIFQNSGICVDSSNTEMKWGLIGRLVATSGGQYSMPWGPAHYAYAERGSCGQGWTTSACATVNSRVGICPAMPIAVDGNQLDFDGEEKHEKTVTSTWCRSGIPAWLKSWTVANFAFAPEAITKFDGWLDGFWKLVSVGGQLQHGSNVTSGGSTPDSWKRIGGHAQVVFGGDRSERTVKFFADLGYKLTDPGDFWVATHQTWGDWSGATAEKFWPSWWGPQPQGAWVSRASSVLERVRGMYAYLPRFKWFPGSGPVVPQPAAPIQLSGRLYADNGSPIRGTLIATCGSERSEFLVVPSGDGSYTTVCKMM